MGEMGEDGYSKAVGFVYLFNLIVGTGSLNLPRALSLGGYVLGSGFLLLLATASFINCTYVNEVSAIANFLRRREEGTRDEFTRALLDPSRPLLQGSVDRAAGGRGGKSVESEYEITQRIEIGESAQMFFSKGGVVAMYITMIAYLYGDLSIYAIVISKSLTTVICPGWDDAGNQTNTKLTTEDTAGRCFNDSVAGMDAYRIFVTCFYVAIVPFCFMNLSKTKYLQAMTSLLRWVSFAFMIIIGFVGVGLSKAGNGGGPFSGTPATNFKEMPSLIGISVYAFMCHHSLPGLLTPVRNKRGLTSMIAGVYLVIVGFYLLLCFSAVAYFEAGDIKSLYTLNFDDISFLPHGFAQFIHYFVALFPVFTLTTSFPIVSSTLVGNISMVLPFEPSPLARRFGLPLAATIPPIALALATDKVETVTTITGAFPGLGIQYIIPMALVFCARRRIRRLGLTDYPNGTGSAKNVYASPFSHSAWLVGLSVWSIFCLVFVGYRTFSDI